MREVRFGETGRSRLLLAFLMVTLVLAPRSGHAAGQGPARLLPPAPAGLRCEGLPDPLGVDTPRPRLNWRLPWLGRGRRQMAYQIAVASSPQRLAGHAGDLWDSGRVVSDRSIQVAYGGKPLDTGEPCYWDVRAWDERGRVSPWSRPARWSMGLLHPGDWKGRWIGLNSSDPAWFTRAQWIWYPEGSPAKSAPVGVRVFRRQVAVPEDRTLTRVSCHVAADNDFVLYVNGHKAAEGSDFHNPQSADLTSLFHPGINTLAIAATNTGAVPSPAGLLGEFRLEFAKGGPLTIATDDHWKTGAQAPAGWQENDFNDSDWESAKALGPNGIAPWMQISDGSRVLPARYLRREFVTTKPIRRATISLCGLGLSELYVNGHKVGNAVLSPALSQYDNRCYYVTYDVTGALHPGRNAIGVTLGNGRFYAPRLTVPAPTRDFGLPRLLFQMDLVNADGSTARVVSDRQWKVTDQGPIRANNEYDGEDYDAHREMPGWDMPGFRDSAWRGADLLPAPGGVLSAQPMCPIRVTQSLRPVAVTRPAPGVFIFDMGQNIAGWCRLTVSGPAGAQVTLRHAETLRRGQLYVDNLRSAQQTDHYRLKGGGVEVYHPRFTIHGFRYVEVRGFPGTPTLDSLRGEVVHDDVPVAGSFACSNPLVNKIYHNVVWGTRDNYRSMPTDCPQRDERQGWLGDRAAESKGESYLFDIDNFYGKWVGDMADTQQASGALPDVCPAYWRFYNDDVTWPSTFILIPGMLYTQYGDAGVLARQYPAMKRWMDHMRGYERDGLMPRDTYGDWCSPPVSPTEIHTTDPAKLTDGTLLATADYDYCLQLMAGYASVLGEAEEARQYRAQAVQMRTAFNARFLHSAPDSYGNDSATSNIFPLALGLVPADRRSQVVDALVRKIVARNGHVDNGLVGGQWLMRALTGGGHPEVAYRIVTRTTYPSWGYMVKNGATTVWELWNGNTADPAMNSGNHVMLVGDLITWLYEDIAGIAPDSARPGFQDIVMRPHPVGDLTCVTATHNSPYGMIRSTWWRNGRRFTWRIRVPANAAASVSVPASGKSGVRENGLPADKSAGVTFLRQDPGAAVYRVGSGEYRFTSELPR